MKRMLIAIALVACVLAAFSAQGAERSSGREKRKADARKEERKDKQRSAESRRIGETYREDLRVRADDTGDAGRIEDQKLDVEPLGVDMAKREREAQKLEDQKLGETRDLEAQTEEAERKARAEEEARKERRLKAKKKRTVDLTILFDW